MKLYFPNISNMNFEFFIIDENGNNKYKVESKSLSFQFLAKILDENLEEIFNIEYDLLKNIKKFKIVEQNNKLTQIYKRFGKIHIKSSNGNFKFEGSIDSFNFDIYRNGFCICEVKKSFIKKSDHYLINIIEDEYVNIIISILIVRQYLYIKQ